MGREESCNAAKPFEVNGGFEAAPKAVDSVPGWTSRVRG